MNRVRILLTGALLLAGAPALKGAAALPCVDQVSSVNSRCELWSRTFNVPPKPPSAVVSDAPAGSVVDRSGRRIYVATTSVVGSHRAVLTVASLNARDGSTMWIGHPRTNLTQAASAITLSRDQRTVVVAGVVQYLPDLNAQTNYYWLTAAFAASSGRQRWAIIDPLVGSYNVPSAVAVSPNGKTVFVTGSSSNGNGAWWSTAAYGMHNGHRLWRASYLGEAGGSNQAVGLAVSPHGDRVYVAGSSEHPEHTGVRTWDEAVVAYNARTGRQVWTRVAHSPENDAPKAVALAPNGRTLFLTGTAVGSKSTAVVTHAFATRTGRLAWTRRFSAPDGVVASALTIDPRGRRLYVAATTGNSAVTAVTSARTAALLAYGTRTGHLDWSRSYGPPGAYDAAATAVTVNRQGSIYVAGVVGPTRQLVGYPFVAGFTSSGRQQWLARGDARDPAAGAVYTGVVDFPTTPVSVTTSATKVFVTVAYEPAATTGLAMACRDAGQSASACGGNGGESALVLAYGR